MDQIREHILCAWTYVWELELLPLALACMPKNFSVASRLAPVDPPSLYCCPVVYVWSWAVPP
jgi:hypothetical protein